ncbi:hypothetical protein DER46DRAFT_614955 [Fusarium sp. MPI-SDFR-AT-0072]|uniref:Uncharacterized protein n=1 Tax=Fusarium oxysporum f. sp. rapae TaxID=485398 RepID=A0A8J5TSW0_FUSOX|nr:hypothetical protein Forpe1208_v011774 [Fusarium oxysporum f. sp. rapae]KAH7151642.1 hypothetical protein DER46DRAFT_614955 [Fusarium sp. MPI-SDFR-AT-0072]
MTPSAQPRKQAGFPPSPPLSPTLVTATKVLSIVRIATGGACFFAPRLTCSLHDYYVPAPYALLVRMMGAREAINGALLFTAIDGKESDGGKRSIRRALWVGILADSMDICSVLYGFAMGEVGITTTGILGTAAAGAITMATLMLRAL